ncbi:MAG: hypothetical protein II875_13335 [Clostridia bacterium]|nr:hypothetical protein [Clostridia bacterium]
MLRHTLADAIWSAGYPGAGILAGKSVDGESAVAAFFVCGLTDSDLQRRFVEDGGGVLLQPAEGAPNNALNIYQPVITFENKMLIGNGAHTESIFNTFQNGKSFGRAVKEQMCLSRDDSLAPRITALIDMGENDFDVDLRITKAADEQGGIKRQSFKYAEIMPGTGYLLSMYQGTPNSFSDFEGEPRSVELGASIFDIVADIWENLSSHERVSLWVKCTSMKSHRSISRIINKNR